MTATASAAGQVAHCSSGVTAGSTSLTAGDSSKAEQTAAVAATSLSYLIIVAWPGVAWTVALISSFEVAASLRCFACLSRLQASWLTRSFARGGTLGPAPAAIVA